MGENAIEQPFVQTQILFRNECKGILFQNLRNAGCNLVCFVGSSGGKFAPFFRPVIVRNTLLDGGEINIPLDMLFRCLQKKRGVLQPVGILQSDGDLPVLRPLSAGCFPLNYIFVKNMP